MLEFIRLCRKLQISIKCQRWTAYVASKRGSFKYLPDCLEEKVTVVEAVLLPVIPDDTNRAFFTVSKVGVLLRMGAAKMKKAQVIISSLESIKISDSLNLVFFVGILWNHQLVRTTLFQANVKTPKEVHRVLGRKMRPKLGQYKTN